MKKRINVLAVISLLLLPFAGAVVYKYRHAVMRLYHTSRPPGVAIDKTAFPITGVDVSQYNGDIRWNEIEAGAVDFAFIKATEGESFVDSKYNQNLSAAARAGIPTGAYHFFRFNKDGRKQALHFLDNVDVKKHKLPPVLDVEQWTNERSQKSRKEVGMQIKAFVETVKERTGTNVIIYSNEDTYKQFVRPTLPNNDLWICTFRFPVFKKWVLWQHRHNGRIKGFDGDVDINTFNGNRQEWEHFLRNN